MLGSWDKSQGRPDLAPGSTLGLELLHTFSYLKSLALSALSGRRPPLCGKAVPTQAPSGSTSGMVRQHCASWVWRREPRDPGPISQALLPACATEASPPLLPPGMQRSVTSASHRQTWPCRRGPSRLRSGLCSAAGWRKWRRMGWSCGAAGSNIRSPH